MAVKWSKHGALAATTGRPCRFDEFRLNLGLGPKQTHACVRDMAQASDIVQLVLSGMGNTLWHTGYDSGDPRVHEVGPFPVGQRRGEVLDAAGNVIAHVSRNGKVWEGTEDDWKSGMKPVYDPVAFRPPPTYDGAAEWIGWFNREYEWKRRHGGDAEFVENPALRPSPTPPALTPQELHAVAQTFGLDKCRSIEKYLKMTGTRSES